MEQEIKELERICRKLTILRHQSGTRLFYGLQQSLFHRFLNLLPFFFESMVAKTEPVGSAMVQTDAAGNVC